MVVEKTEFLEISLILVRQTHRHTDYECSSSLCLSWELIGLGCKLGWARLTDIIKLALYASTPTVGEISSNLYRASVRDMKKNNFQICMLSQNLLYNVQGT